MDRSNVSPDLIRWARKRSSIPIDALQARWPKYPLWESGEASPTPRQLEELARRTQTPLGLFYMPAAPNTQLEVADLRNIEARRPVAASPSVLEAVHICRFRQHWYREKAIAEGARPLKFIGRSGPGDPVVKVADTIRRSVDWTPSGCIDPVDALPALERMIAGVERAGIMVMRGGRAVEGKGGEPDFRGLVLADAYAPLIYLDATDVPAAQIFTLAHELVHLWLGTSGISNPRETLVSEGRVLEIFCNRVAAEALVPLAQFREEWVMREPLEAQSHRLAGVFCVSPFVILRRAYDADFIDGETFHNAYAKETERVAREATIRGVAGMPLTPVQRVGRRFGEAVAAAVQAHRLTEQEAMALLGACTPEEVWAVSGSHDDYISVAPSANETRAFAHLAGSGW